jgi:hypothetical protein
MFTFKKQTPEEYAAKLKEMLGGCLRSVTLYGSATTADHIKGTSDYNVLVIADKWSVLELNQVSKVSQRWMREGNAPPLLFTPYRWQSMVETFPIEVLDMKQAYRVVLGEDFLKSTKVQAVHLRLMTQREIGSLKIQLRQGFLYANGEPRKIAHLMVKTLSATLALFRAALRLYVDAVPTKKIEALPMLAERIKGIDVEAIQTIHNLKHGSLKISKVNPLNLFQRYIDSLTVVGDAINPDVKKA